MADVMATSNGEPTGRFPVDDWAVHDHLPRHSDGIHVRIGMVSSLDGHITRDGTSAGLGGAYDLAALKALRHHADAVLNGANTVISEDLWPGQRPHIVLTGTDRLDVHTRLFDPQRVERLLIIATQTVTPDALTAWREAGARVVQVDGPHVEMNWLIPWLRDEYGIQRLLCEGGPSLNRQLANAGLVDEWCLTLALTLLGHNHSGERKDQAHADHGDRIVTGLTHDHPLHLRQVCLTPDEVIGIYTTHLERGHEIGIHRLR